ncbi:GNAT family N-acetyltransferase [Muricoccus aerilatus]|uniref:GNAT family N-acetyltransferase n=1 Tax=Muricoccus aerilatus TaxID=452982 RepID=UPI000A6EC145|nr:GNAT family N-acetyltransferase [Roseomonas aerilata]
MHAHLERVGRFDPARRRARMRAAFDPAAFRLIESGGHVRGCVAVVDHADHREIHSFYLEPEAQGRGLGRAVLDAILAEHPGRATRLEVLKGSSAARFYERAGFHLTGEAEFDLLYERPGLGATPPGS